MITLGGPAMHVGFIGLGSQGAPMARRIVHSGYETTLWARRPEARVPFADTAAKFAESAAELGAASDLVCICVGSDADVLDVVTGEDGVLAGMKPGGIIAVHSTVHPDTCRELGETAATRGISVVDAPVSGGGIAATEGRLLVMVGGSDEDFERVRPVFSMYANPVVHLGPLGSGQITKLLNNLLFTANLATAANTLALGQSLGVDPNRLGDVISHGTANSFALSRIVSAGGTLERIAQHAGTLLQKDVGLIADLATTAQAPTGVVLTAADATLELMDHRR
jgi:3-hydroxyisobutyrate dehydrogenase